MQAKHALVVLLEFAMTGLRAGDFLLGESKLGTRAHQFVAQGFVAAVSLVQATLQIGDLLLSLALSRMQPRFKLAARFVRLIEPVSQFGAGVFPSDSLFFEVGDLAAQSHDLRMALLLGELSSLHPVLKLGNLSKLLALDAFEA